MHSNFVTWSCKIIASILLINTAIAYAAEDYSVEEFLATAFPNSPPKAAKLWIKKDLKHAIKAIMGRDLNALRINYWQQHQRSAWILETIGKERLITAGLTIQNGKIENIQVLAFRESRGWEIRYPFFTDQFRGATLNPEHDLSRHIDGISGATLSVTAMKKMARLALLLDQKINQAD